MVIANSSGNIDVSSSKINIIHRYTGQIVISCGIQIIDIFSYIDIQRGKFIIPAVQIVQSIPIAKIERTQRIIWQLHSLKCRRITQIEGS